MKRLLKTFTIILLTSASTIACSQENLKAMNSDTSGWQASNLCNADEESIFACYTEKKIASLCLRQYEGNVHIEYRYGTTKKIELSYPGAQVESSEGFKLSTTPYPGGGENRIRFTIGEYNYYLYGTTRSESDGGGQYPVFKAGIVVIRNDKKFYQSNAKMMQV